MSGRHTPYDGSSKPFTIGLKPLDPTDWIEVDDCLGDYLDEKDRLAARVPHEIFASLPGSEAAQAELLGLLLHHLTERFPDIYSHLGAQIDVVPAFRRLRLDDPFIPALLMASGLVQDDLILLQKRTGGWTVTAGALAFPSSWRLSEKLGKPMHYVHSPVPGFGEGTRNATLIERIFDNLRPEQPVMRWNWSLYGNDRLHHPDHAPAGRFGDGEVAEHVFLRLERQTLRKLPETGAIVFTIRIYVDPLQVLQTHDDGPALAQTLGKQVRAMEAEQLAYKGLTHDVERLLARLDMLAAG